MSAAAGLANSIARVEKTTMADSDVLRISLADIAQEESLLRERMATILSRPLMCSACSRALSVEYGTGGREKGSAQ
jgi:hypothetical protein